MIFCLLVMHNYHITLEDLEYSIVHKLYELFFSVIYLFFNIFSPLLSLTQLVTLCFYSEQNSIIMKHYEFTE